MSRVDQRRLSPRGRAQARETADRLARELEGVRTRVVSSPARRCTETAAPIAAGLGVEVEVERGLADQRRGDNADPVAVAAAAGRPWGLGGLPGAEPWQAVFDRSRGVLIGLDEDRLPVLVTHESNVHMLCASWMGLDHEGFRTMAFDAWFGSITVLRAGLFGQGAIERLADAGHLSDGGPPRIGTLWKTVPQELRAFEEQTQQNPER